MVNKEIAVACQVRQWIIENKEMANRAGFTTKSISDELDYDHSDYKKASAALSKMASNGALKRVWNGPNRTYIYRPGDMKLLERPLRKAPEFHNRVVTKRPQPWTIDKGPVAESVYGTAQVAEVKAALVDVANAIAEPTLADNVLESAISLEKEGPSRPLGLRLMEQALEVMRRAK